jgi:uncharacterized protein YfaS (alpha-2-macroglobulin family)
MDKKCHVEVTVSNPNNKEVTTTVKVSGDSGLKGVSKKLTIPAKGSRTVSTYFTVKKVVRNGTVTATESLTGQGASKSGLQLIPN